MASLRLLDALLVVVARRVQRWADRILAEREGAEHAAPHGGEAAPPDGDGPPAHWLEMVRARAPHLLSMQEQSFEAPGAPGPGGPFPWPPSIPSPRSAMADAPAGGLAQHDRGASPATPVHPASVPGEPPALAEPAPPSAAPVSAWRSPAPSSSIESAPWAVADAGSPGAASPRPLQSAASAAPRSPGPRVRSPDVPSLPSQEPTRWRWRIQADGDVRPTHWRGEPPPPARTDAPPQPPRRARSAEPSPPRVAAIAPTRATPLHEPPARPLDRACDARPEARPAAEPPWPAPWPHLSDEDERGEGAALSRSRWSAPPPLPGPGLWPRLSDEDEAPPRSRPTEPAWPALPSDEPVLELPMLEEDHGRVDRLRGEQQGARCSEPHS